VSLLVVLFLVVGLIVLQILVMKGSEPAPLPGADSAPISLPQLLIQTHSGSEPAPSATPSPPPVVVAAKAEHGRACPFCKDSIAEGSVHVECATCTTWHHATCFEENGGCSVFGCREQRGRGVAGRVR
jgi:hypothetical protein